MEKSGFFNDINGDRVYFAEDVARKLRDYFTNGIFNNGCMVLGENDDMSVNVDIGSANINGYSYHNDSKRLLLIDNADGVLNRIDNVVLRLDLTSREIISKVIKGEFATEPVAPDLVRSATIYDLRIAKINIPAGTTTITQDLIEDTRFINSDCGNVICSVETPNTEELYAQLYAKAEKLIKDSQKNFEDWFNTIKNTLDGDVAGNLANQITLVKNKVDSIELKTYTTTLKLSNWILNEETEKYEYNVSNANITTSHYIMVDFINQEDAETLGACSVNSYDGGFIIEASELPESDIMISVLYQLSIPEEVSNNEG
ncbi:MAG: hypothetical protein NC483_00490 [Ruminococcus sp.]|nr:hypothetical protein [Ruminococcus sp.]